MIEKIHFKTIGVAWLLFFICQLTVVFITGKDLFSVFGVIHYIWLSLFFIFYIISQKKSTQQIYVNIILYQTISVLSLYAFYVFHYNSPLGFHAVDAVFYDSLGRKLQNMSSWETIRYLKIHVDISDMGFPIVVKYVYELGGNQILNMKIVNIIVYVLSASFVYKLTKLLTKDLYISKTVLILYGLNPMSIFYSSTGLKGAFFVLVISLCFYLCYKAIIYKSFKNYLFAFIWILSTALFRIVFPFFILLAFGLYLCLYLKGKYKSLVRPLLLVLGIGILFVVYFLTKERFTHMLSVDKTAVAAANLGGQITLTDYIILTISGIIGPFPYFIYGGYDLNLLQTIVNFVKLFFSYFFLAGTIIIFKNKKNIFFPILLFILFNVIMLVSVARTLDPRFLYPFMPIYFIVIGYGFNEIRKKRRFPYFLHYLLCTTAIVILYNLHQ